MGRQLGVQLAQELNEVNLQRRQPVPKLYDIQSALAPFNLADEPLMAAEQVRQIPLAKALALPCGLELLQKDVVVAGVKDLGHGQVHCTP